MQQITHDEIIDASTEQKIKQAARNIFHKKGFAATRTRDIAQEAGINVALLNYYFRSKANLFDLIMLETMQSFWQGLGDIVNDSKTSLKIKIGLIVESYTDLWTKEPQLPLFVVNEMHNNPQQLFAKIPYQTHLQQSVMVQQYQQAINEGKARDLPFVQLVINIISLTIFPFVAGNMVKMVGQLNDEQLQALIDERKKLVPIWVKAIMKAK